MVDLVRDAQRFILRNKWVIENAPLQAYASALVFSPAGSLTRSLFRKEEPRWIVTKPIMEREWSTCLQTLEGHTGEVTSVAFSHDSRLLASGSLGMTIKIWDVTTGASLQTLYNNAYYVISIVFSHGLRLLASGSLDKTIKILDVATGACLKTLRGHTYSVDSVV